MFMKHLCWKITIDASVRKQETGKWSANNLIIRFVSKVKHIKA